MNTEARPTITRAFLEKLDTASDRQADAIYRDAKQKNFGVRVSPGAISFFVQRKMGGSTSVKRTLGSYPAMTVEEARKKAAVWLGWMAEGIDPLLRIKQQQAATLAAQEKSRRTFGKVFLDYASIKASSSAALTIRDREKTAQKLQALKLWHMPFDEIKIETVERDLAPQFEKHLATGWRIYRYSRAAYAFEAEKLQISGNPFSLWRKWKRPQLVQRREEILPTGEAAGQAWLKALMKLRDDPRFSVSVTADYLLCLLLWGGRKTETQKLTTSDIDFKNAVAVFRGRNTKNKRDHFFPLTPWAVEIVKARIEKNGDREGDWVFASRVAGKSLVDVRNVLGMLAKESGLTIRPHDLRRTFASELVGDTGSNLFLVKSAMNHAGINQDVTVGYFAIKAKVDALRPAYEVREARLKRLSGQSDPEVAEPDKLLSDVQAAANNPLLKEKLLALLQGSST
ncbi:tyrosine-type recombinase/integrase [Solimonas variicoloris]|uniref:tyrosine-type recombinase/integrase n=1 Tax=Solimonas variicoloris TaxID=254408 RepID=UPI000A040EDA|nr:integrase family protein [Solimonas variicoloris]